MVAGIETDARALTVPTLGMPSDLLQSFGASEFPDTYAGVVVHGNAVTVYLTQLTPAAEEAFAAVQSTDSVDFQVAARSERSLGATHQLLTNAWDRLLSQGVQVNRFWPHLETGLEEVGVVNLKPTDLTAIDNVVGAGLAHVFSMTPEEAAQTVGTASRITDTSPFNGGDSFTDGVSSTFCSTGFGVTISGVSRLLTAGHCYANDVPVENKIVDPSGPGGYSGGGADMGTVFGRQVSCCDANGMFIGDVDSELLSAQGSSLVWRGAIGASYRATVSGRASNAEGLVVCNLGSASGEVCSTESSEQNMCITFSDGPNTYRTCHETLSQNLNGGIANEGGDSGGPVIHVSGGLVYGTGLVSAEDLGVDQIPCVHYAYNKCSLDMYLTGLYYALLDSSAALKTG